jgi:transcriptional regulator with PAS, ATPase and Fis domain
VTKDPEDDELVDVTTTRPVDEPHSARIIRRAALTITDGPGVGGTFVTAGAVATVGTNERADWVLTDPTVSRFHFALELTGDAVVVRDLSSRNGTCVQGVRVREAYLEPGHVIQVGRTRISYALDPRAAAVPVVTRERFGALVGKSVPMREAFALLEKAAASAATVLLLGETGSGKEAAAESIHTESERKAGPFVVVDCASIPAPLLESELFGHERGAFTGAQGAREGAFEAADGGTVFLDEIGELPVELQPKLLRVLERREVKRLGQNSVRPIDVRIIAATNRDLRAEVNAKRFRPDLFYRLAVLEIRLPPLRERTEDLLLIAREIVSRIEPDSAVRERLLLDPSLASDLASHHWPGNVRELRNYLERSIALGARAPLDGGRAESPLADDVHRPLREARDRVVEAFERDYLARVLARADGNVSAAARAAGVDRMHFYRMLWKYGMR